MGIPRKRHADEAGYIAERMNPFVNGEKITIYIATKQGIDVAPNKYAIVCDAHSTLVGAMTLKDARLVMKNPHNFCEECVKAGQELKPAVPKSQLCLNNNYLAVHQLGSLRSLLLNAGYAYANIQSNMPGRF